MKKLIALLLALLLVATFLVACGGRPTTLREYMDANPEELEEFLEEMEAEAQAMSRMLGVQISIDVYVSGDHEMVLDFIIDDPTFLIDSEFGPLLSEEFAAELAAEADYYTEIAVDMRRSLRISTLYVTMRYLDANGAVFAEQTFAGH